MFIFNVNVEQNLNKRSKKEATVRKSIHSYHLLSQLITRLVNSMETQSLGTCVQSTALVLCRYLFAIFPVGK